MAGTRIELSINRPVLNREAQRASYDSVLAAANVTVERARSYLDQGRHNNTGRLSRSITAHVTRSDGDGTTMNVGSNLDYAKWVENGRGPVYPKRAKVLRFKPRGSSKFIFRAFVGPAKPVHFLKRAFADLRKSDFVKP